MTDENKYINDSDLHRFNSFLQGDWGNRPYYDVRDLPPLEELFAGPIYYAILYLSNPTTAVGHWCVLVKHSEQGEYEYFDCLGLPPPQQVINLFQQAAENKTSHRALKLSWLKEPLMSKTGILCGKYVMMRLQTLPNSLDEFYALVKKLSSVMESPDHLVDTLIKMPFASE